MTPQRVTLITLGVDDLDRARDFYARLGWTPTREVAGEVAFYQMHGTVLGLFGRAALAADQGRPGAALGTGAMTLAQNFPTEAEVDAAFARALAAGATSLKTPEKVFWGGYSGYVADPDGHVWESAMNPSWPLQPDGSLILPGAAETIAEPALSREDEAAITDLLNRVFDTDFGNRSYFHQRPHHRHVIRADGRIVAHLAVMHRAIRMGDRLVTIDGIGDVASDPDHRGQGHAGTLLKRAMAAAQGSPTTDFVVLFGDRPLYAGHGLVPQRQRLRYVEMDGARMGEVVEADSDGLMVWPCGTLDWDGDALIDLLGDKF